MELLHTMRVAARRSGLNPHVIRVWERRYGAVTPTRSRTRRRLYSESEIFRLRMLGEATKAGHGIGQIARLSEDELLKLLEREQKSGAVSVAAATPAEQGPRDYVEEGLGAVRALDAATLERLLGQAAADFGQLGLVNRVIVPLVERIGESWREGSLKVAQEHVATAAIRSLLGGFARSYAPPETAPRLLVTTPAGQVHELGAILVAVVASNLGWRVTYLGPSLPAEEIAGAAMQDRARAVALSIVYPEDDPHLESELSRLRQLLPPDVAILVGGRAAAAYRRVFEAVGAIQLDEVGALRAALDEQRKDRHAPRQK